LSVLVTSRAALHVYGEQLFQVPALALPDRQRLPQPATLVEDPAIRLFTTRVQALRADFALTTENAPGIVEICAGLDGLRWRSGWQPPAASGWGRTDSWST